MGYTVTLNDVAEHAGVHRATAGRALNPATQEMVHPATLQRVLDSAHELNYRTNAAARSLRTQRTATVGVVIPDIRNPLFPPIVAGIDDVLDVAGYASLVVYTGGRDDRLVDHVDRLRQRGVDGLIVATARRRDTTLDRLQADQVPIVQVNRRTENKAIASVTVDDAGGSKAAVEYLVELGHERIAHLGSVQNHSTGRARLAGYKAAMRRAGLPIASGLTPLTRAVTTAEGARVGAALLEEHPEVTAILAGNDLLALGCYEAARAMDLRCPKNVSIIGFNDMPFADHFDPPLTTVHFDAYEMGNAAAQLLLRQLRSEGPPSSASHIEMETRLVIRQSAAPPA
jgi:LacI family transcriptional regulator